MSRSVQLALMWDYNPHKISWVDGGKPRNTNDRKFAARYYAQGRVQHAKPANRIRIKRQPSALDLVVTKNSSDIWSIVSDEPLSASSPYTAGYTECKTYRVQNFSRMDNGNLRNVAASMLSSP